MLDANVHLELGSSDERFRDPTDALGSLLAFDLILGDSSDIMKTYLKLSTVDQSFIHPSTMYECIRPHG